MRFGEMGTNPSTKTSFKVEKVRGEPSSAIFGFKMRGNQEAHTRKLQLVSR